MPKIIENLESRLMEEAKKQLLEFGYGALTIRSVAKGCGVGIGTVYNYYASKDDMIAMVMLKDMDQCVEAMRGNGEDSDSVEAVLRRIYEELVRFAKAHSAMFRDKAEADAFVGSFNTYRGRLREQIARILRKDCQSDFAAEFVAEAMLTWTMARKSFDEIFDIIEKLFVVPDL